MDTEKDRIDISSSRERMLDELKRINFEDEPSIFEFYEDDYSEESYP